MRALLLAVVAGAALADVCSFNTSTVYCPGDGQTCTEKTMCQSGMFCKATTSGQSSWTGTCSSTPGIADVYGAPCKLGNEFPDCVYNNPLSLTPGDRPSTLQCIRAYPTDTVGTCRIGPNKHGDACNQDGECASGNCLKEIGLCEGVDEGESCEPGFPDPCRTGHFCSPNPSGYGGYCAKAVSAGRACKSATACERGFFCAGPALDQQQCLPPFSVAVGQNTTIGPYMCSSANAVLVRQGSGLADSIYQCVDANATMVGQPCNLNTPAPLGYECKCSADGVTRLVTKGLLGLGARSQVWRDLFTCLVSSTGIMGDLCEFDSVDMERIRYGSCGYYSCYPRYLQLVNVTGGRVYTPPFSQFYSFSECQASAIKSYYAAVNFTECAILPSLENWKCASLLPPTSLSVGATVAVNVIIIIAVVVGFLAHGWYFKNGGLHTLPLPDFIKSKLHR